MAPRSRGGFFRRLFDRLFGEEPPEQPPPTPPPDDDDYDDLERRALRHIDSFHLENLPPRTDRKGNVHKAEYNRNRVAERLQQEPYANLLRILDMGIDEFRSWAKATGFFYH